jgi:hypothetical protein
MYRTREEPSCDTALLDHLRSICEVYASDAAADEQLAGQMLRPDSGRTGSKAQLPNLRLVIRDAAHASKRLLSRTWCQEPYIKRLLDALLWNNNSLAKPFATRAFSKTFSRTTNENGGRTQPNPSSRILLLRSSDSIVWRNPWHGWSNTSIPRWTW